MTITLHPGATSLAELETIWRSDLRVQLDVSARIAIDASAATMILIASRSVA